MNSEIAENRVQNRRVGRSIVALIAGFAVNIVLTLGTDAWLSVMGILPALGQQPMNHAQSVLATVYRTLYSVISSYVVARLAPYRPMEHALTGAGIGMALATIGAIATWHRGLGPHWYPLALIVLALPTGWLGGKLRVMQMK
jgi:hypothetical protein